MAFSWPFFLSFYTQDIACRHSLGELSLKRKKNLLILTFHAYILHIYLLAILFINPIVFIAVLISISIYIGYIYFVGPGLIDKSRRSTVSGGYAYSSTLSAIDAVDTVKSMSLQVGALDAFLTNFNKQSSIKDNILFFATGCSMFINVT